MIFETVRQYAIRTALITAAVTLLLALLLVLLWRDRPSLQAIGWPEAVIAETNGEQVSVTWLGVSMLLIDDGETQLLVDAFVSRPGIWESLLRLDVASDIPQIDAVMHDFQMRRLAAIIPAHSHYDHVMDVGAFANRSSASVLGSESTLNIARGAQVPDDQLLLVQPGEPYTFGEFIVTLHKSPHGPIGWRGGTPLPGELEEPLALPASIAAMREGGSYSIVISHPQGTMLIQASAGINAATVDDVQADVVFLGAGLLESLGRSYAERYWQAHVTATGASRVFPVHFDDFTKPFGEIVPMPRIVDDFGDTAGWFNEFQQTWDKDVSLHLPVFGKPVAVYASPAEPSS